MTDGPWPAWLCGGGSPAPSQRHGDLADDVSTDSAESDPELDSLEAAPDLPQARPQKLPAGDEVWPEHWGITRQQLAHLLHELRQDIAWRAENNVYTLVKDFIVPWTAGEGIGYALSVNQDAPKEVNVMVSHAWGENAEEFLETLIRSAGTDDVMFICALSIYQAEDVAGPSISEQLGSTPAESPFRRVLQHIKDKGEAMGWRWRRRKLLKWSAWVMMLVASMIFFLTIMHLSCVPSLTHCAYSPLKPPDGNRPDWTEVVERLYKPTMARFRLQWTWKRMGPYFPVVLLSTATCLVCALFCALSYACFTYRGRMIVVPNREVDIYSRLWCVYEIFTAKTLGVTVQIAQTLAPAGNVRAKFASCGNLRDMQHILREIKASGTTFKRIDRVVFRTTRGVRWQTIRVMVYLGVPMALCSAAWQGLQACEERLCHARFAAGASFVVCTTDIGATYFVFRRGHGHPSVHSVICLLLFMLALGLLLAPLPHPWHWYGSRLLGDALCDVVILVCALLAPRVFSRFDLWTVISMVVFLGAAVAVAMAVNNMSLESLSIDKLYPELVYQVVFVLQSWWYLIFVSWCIALYWGTGLSLRGESCCSGQSVSCARSGTAAADPTK